MEKDQHVHDNEIKEMEPLQSIYGGDWHGTLTGDEVFYLHPDMPIGDDQMVLVEYEVAR